MNNMVMVDHHGCSYIWTSSTQGHTMTLISFAYQTSTIHGVNFFHIDEYFQYLLGDPSYSGKEMFVMCYIGRLDLAPRIHMDVIEVYNKMHQG